MTVNFCKATKTPPQNKVQIHYSSLGNKTKQSYEWLLLESKHRKVNTQTSKEKNSSWKVNTQTSKEKNLWHRIKIKPDDN